MPTTTPLTDAITALTTYSNTVTGASDTDLSSAVATLAAGYGGSGAEDDLIAVLSGTFSGAFYNDKITRLKGRSFSNLSNLTSVSLPNLEYLADRAFEGCSNCEVFNLPRLSTANAWAFAGNGKNGSVLHLPKLTGTGNGFSENSKFGIIVLPLASNLGSYTFNGSKLLTAVDVLGEVINQNTFKDCTSLETIIIRSTTVSQLNNVTAFSNNARYTSGGAGGKIYIPKSLYDALGTGTNDYKSATNWSTVDGYGTITWKPIEGSYYETHYADGTAISS
jgi:hypothetical protein